MLKKKKSIVIDDQVDKLNQKIKTITISLSLKENIDNIKKLFFDDDNLIIREFNNNHQKGKFVLIYCDGLVNSVTINESIIKPLIHFNKDLDDDNLIQSLIKNVLLVDDIKKVNYMKDIVENVTYGDSILFIEGSDEALILNTKLFSLRSISEPDGEKIFLGPREGFNESIFTNISLLRRRLRTNDFKIRYYTLGDKTNTKVALCYIDSIVDKKILAELYQRLQKIKIDGVIDSNYITELIKDNKWSPFRTTGYSEKPDSITGKILEGNIAIIVDGSPIVLSIPFFFVENFHSSEDYYVSYFYSTFSRIIRIMGFIFTVCVPALYIAIVAYHHEMLPSSLFFNIAMERRNVPLPAALEIFVMLIVFDILKETGIRMSNNIGQSLSIVGAVVIGQATVDANLVAAPIIIVIAFTGITGLMVPKLSVPIIVCRFLLFILSSSLGLFGFLIGVSFIIVHILNLKSFGIAQINVNGDFTFQSIKDTIFRAPWWEMKKRPEALTENMNRMDNNEVDNYEI
ncbi:MAG: spore germination protein [Bacilli bacterium]|nr:spore germination protein [Bacilli bacterium]MDD4808950.1 spore germination protein [Bacilli bacterium]